jgi:hypothetical protein
MKTRIAIWAAAGALVAVFWTVYISATLRNPLGAGGIGGALVRMTCPIAMASHHPLSFYLVLTVNAATYGLAGVAVESARRYCQVRSISS